MDAFTVCLPTALLDAFRERAADRGLTTGQMLRLALENWLDRH